MLTRLSAMTPSPTQRCLPASPLSRQRFSACRCLTTLMRSSHPVRFAIFDRYGTTASGVEMKRNGSALPWADEVAFTRRAKALDLFRPQIAHCIGRLDVL